MPTRSKTARFCYVNSNISGFPLMYVHVLKQNDLNYYQVTFDLKISRLAELVLQPPKRWSDNLLKTKLRQKKFQGIK